MKVLIVTAQEELKRRFERLYPGVELIHYWHPIKAMDNLDEIAPDMVVFSHTDFPRHWKAFLTYMRAERTKEELPFFLLSSRAFETEESTQANLLDATDVMLEEDLAPGSKSLLAEMIEKRRPAAEPPSGRRGLRERAELAFMHPRTFGLFTCEVSRLERTHLAFSPPQGLATGMRIEAASFKMRGFLCAIDLELAEVSAECIKGFYLSPPPEFTRFLSTILDTSAPPAYSSV